MGHQREATTCIWTQTQERSIALHYFWDKFWGVLKTISIKMAALRQGKEGQSKVTKLTSKAQAT